ncbi:MAG: hypothetical protein AAF652_21320, partial [Cyanobacteria bacterium P01_C01_bin.72]
DLLLDHIEINGKLKRSLNRRMVNLSKLICLLGKYHNDSNSLFNSISQDIYDKSNWLNAPKNTTVSDLQIYFSKVNNCLINGKIEQLR